MINKSQNILFVCLQLVLWSALTLDWVLGVQCLSVAEKASTMELVTAEITDFRSIDFLKHLALYLTSKLLTSAFIGPFMEATNPWSLLGSIFFKQVISVVLYPLRVLEDKIVLNPPIYSYRKTISSIYCL